MTDTIAPCPISKKTDTFGGDLVPATDGDTVGKEDRKFRVLAFLVDSRLALPRLALYRNLTHHGADFSDSSLKNYLRELREEGYVTRIDAEAFGKGKVITSDEDPGYWLATVEGADHVDEMREDQRSEIDTSHL